MTEAGADGKTTVQELTPDQIRAMNEAARQAHAKAQEGGAAAAGGVTAAGGGDE